MRKSDHSLPSELRDDSSEDSGSKQEETKVEPMDPTSSHFPVDESTPEEKKSEKQSSSDDRSNADP